MILAVVFSTTIILSVLGMIFGRSDIEKQQGLTNIYDISTEGMIAYAVYESGQPGIYLQHDQEIFDNPILQLDLDQEVLDMSFSPDGQSLAYVVSNKDKEVSIGSSVLLLEIETMEQKRLFGDQGLITEISFDPKDADLLFYFRAGTFENYSPIASVHPHEFDLFSYCISDGEKIRHTEMEQYSMRSLNVSPIDNAVFVQMDDDADVKTAEDIFETKQRIFRISIEQQEDISVVSQRDRTTDIYDFAIVPNKNEVIFQSVSKTNKNGTFEYELYHYNLENEQETQLTYLKESTSNPIISPQSNKVFFMVDKQFGKKYADYHLYQMDMDGSNQKEVKLGGLVDE